MAMEFSLTWFENLIYQCGCALYVTLTNIQSRILVNEKEPQPMIYILGHLCKVKTGLFSAYEGAYWSVWGDAAWLADGDGWGDPTLPLSHA